MNRIFGTTPAVILALKIFNRVFPPLHKGLRLEGSARKEVRRGITWFMRNHP